MTKFLQKIMAGTFFLSLFTIFSAQAAPELTIKCASLAPDGTVLAKSFKTMADQIKKQTAGRIVVKNYLGGVAGDEKDVVRKMRIGQLHCAGLTGVGLGMIDSEFRVMELPFLFDNYAQADYVMKEMKPFFEKKAQAKGFELLGWAEVGFVKIFSNKPIRKKDDLSGLKMWMWEGDPLAQAMYEAVNVVPVPLAITDVLTSLQTDLINACYAPELGAIAFQWHTKVKYVTDIPLVDGTGGLVVSSKTWNKMKPADQKIVRKIISDQSKKLIAQSRKDNKQSLEVLKQLGIEVIKPDANALAEFKAIMQTVPEKLIGKLFEKETYEKVKALVAKAPKK